MKMVVVRTREMWLFLAFSTCVLLKVVTPIEFCTNGYYHPGCVPYNCTRDAQCRVASPGRYSRCRIEFGRCECFHNNRPGIALNNTCLPVKRGGEVCTSDNDCKSIRGSSGCLGLSSFGGGNQRGICGCRDFRDLYHEERNECLKLQTTEGTSCHVDIQCSHVRALGSLSVCELQSSTCRCWDTITDGAEPTGWYAGKCYYSRADQESCDFREECVIGFHPNAVCLRDETYRNSSVCACPKNEICVDPQKDAARYSASTSSSINYNYVINLQLIFIKLSFYY